MIALNHFTLTPETLQFKQFCVVLLAMSTQSSNHNGKRGPAGRRDSGETWANKRHQQGNGNDKAVSNPSLSVHEQMLGVLRAQNALLRSIGGRLQHIERQGQQENSLARRTHRPPRQEAAVVNGAWKFVESPEAVRRIEQAIKRRQSIQYVVGTHPYEEEWWFGRVRDKGSAMDGGHYPSAGHLRRCGLFCYLGADLQSIDHTRPLPKPEWGDDRSMTR